MIPISFKRYRFPPEIIQHAVWLYARFTRLLKKQGVAPKRITTDNSDHTPSPSAERGCLPFMTTDFEQTTEPRIHTSRPGSESENSSASSRQDQPTVSCRSTPPSKTLFTFNAIFYRAVSSRSFELMRLLSDSRVGSRPDLRHDRILTTKAINVSMPFRASSTHARIEVGSVTLPANFFGIGVASPGPAGQTSRKPNMSGTSVATALATHNAMRILEALEDLPDDPAIRKSTRHTTPSS